MFSILDVFYLVFSQLAVGGFVLLLLVPKELVGANFYRLMGSIYLLVGGLSRCKPCAPSATCYISQLLRILAESRVYFCYLFRSHPPDLYAELVVQDPASHTPLFLRRAYFRRSVADFECPAVFSNRTSSR